MESNKGILSFLVHDTWVFACRCCRFRVSVQLTLCRLLVKKSYITKFSSMCFLIVLNFGCFMVRSFKKTEVNGTPCKKPNRTKNHLTSKFIAAVQCTLSTKHGTNRVLCTYLFCMCIIGNLWPQVPVQHCTALALPGLCSAEAGLLLVQPGG